MGIFHCYVKLPEGILISILLGQFLNSPHRLIHNRGEVGDVGEEHGHLYRNKRPRDVLRVFFGPGSFSEFC